MTRVVQLLLLGSILSNMLLVLGCAFLCGGIISHKKEQVFNKATAAVNSGLLLMAVMGLLFPVVLHYTYIEVRFQPSESCQICTRIAREIKVQVSAFHAAAWQLNAAT